jgi:hypothetical protein
MAITKPRHNLIRTIPCIKHRAGYATPPAMTALAPLTASIAAAGAVGRVIADINAVGGTAPFTFSIAANPDAIKVGINPNDGKIYSQLDPIGPTGAAHNLSVKCVDGYGLSLTNIVSVTLT